MLYYIMSSDMADSVLNKLNGPLSEKINNLIDGYKNAQVKIIDLEKQNKTLNDEKTEIQQNYNVLKEQQDGQDKIKENLINENKLLKSQFMDLSAQFDVANDTIKKSLEKDEEGKKAMQLFRTRLTDCEKERKELKECTTTTETLNEQIKKLEQYNAQLIQTHENNINLYGSIIDSLINTINNATITNETITNPNVGGHPTVKKTPNQKKNKHVADFLESL